MKKISKAIVGVTLLSSLFVGSAFASEDVSSNQEDVTKDANSELTVSDSSVLTDETVNLTANTEKKGSSYSIIWTDNVNKGDTVLEDSYYISTGTFSSNEAGSYEVGYSVLMRAGKSHVTWVDDEKATIVVTSPVIEEKNNGSNNGVGTGSKENPSNNNKGENASNKK